jgi:hypothetical protein
MIGEETLLLGPREIVPVRFLLAAAADSVEGDKVDGSGEMGEPRIQSIVRDRLRRFGVLLLVLGTLRLLVFILNGSPVRSGLLIPLTLSIRPPSILSGSSRNGSPSTTLPKTDVLSLVSSTSLIRIFVGVFVDMDIVGLLALLLVF